jgi:predicted GH43/DUF377 family glycosyl hydrolase
MLTESQRQLVIETHRQALAVPVSPMQQGLRELQFAGDYGPHPAPWRIGPFHEVPELAFRKRAQWPDPLGFGWTSSALFNPSLLPFDGKLAMAYRAAARKETLSSRIGIAVFLEGDGWTDLVENPVLYPTEPDELLGCEDPKLYRLGGTFYLFYQAVWLSTEEQRTELNRGSLQPVGEGCTTTKLAVSRDLRHWEKKGPAIPLSVSRGYSKGAVIVKAPDGTPVKVKGSYLMLPSEGMGGRQHVGYSDDLLHWEFEQVTYLDLPPALRLEELATAVLAGDNIVLDFYYTERADRSVPRAGQARYHLADPLSRVDLALDGGTLAWGGIVEWREQWLCAQGWDAPPGTEELYFYGAPLGK